MDGRGALRAPPNPRVGLRLLLAGLSSAPPLGAPRAPPPPWAAGSAVQKQVALFLNHYTS